MSGGGETIKKKIRPPGTTSRDINLDILSQRSQKDEVETLNKFYQDYKVKLRNAQIDITDFQIQIERKHRIIEEINIVVKRYSSQINVSNLSINYVLYVIIFEILELERSKMSNKRIN